MSGDATVEHVDVLVVGAGLSGIGAAHHLQTDCPWATYAVLEARDAIGGTWDLFRYPGIRSDSDMHTLGYSFRPWANRDSIADGASILAYIRETAAEAGIDRHIRFGHRVLHADWSTVDARWTVTAERTDTGETVELTCSFLFSCSGYYRYDHGHQPDFPGIDRFRGTTVHPQAWPDDLDYAGKRVVVIGSGATAVTLVPSMAETAGHVTMLQRSPSYVVSVPKRSPAAAALRAVLPGRYAEGATRWVHALGTQGMYQVSRRRPELVRRALRKGVEQQLPAGYDVDTHFTPRYDPWDQRLCAVPDGDLFAAIRAGTASVVTDHIETFTETGLRLTSGAELDADIIVTATGLEMLFIGGMQLSLDGEALDLPSRLTYKGMMLEGVPNFALAVGYTNASWTLKAELTCDYVCRLLDHLRATGLRQCTPVNRDPDIETSPLMGLSSGYIQRSMHEFPKSGARFPWQVHQSYLRDYRAMKMRDVVDGVMSFSNPGAGAPAPTTGSAGAPMWRFEGGVAAITGAGSGIGRALAEELARRGTHLALSDIDESGLAETVSRCEGLGVKVTAQELDVADRDAVFAWADRVVDDHGTVNLVVNNAGVALVAPVASMSIEDFRWLMDIDFWGVVHGTQAFLPHLRAADKGHVVNISSVFGLLSIPAQSAYNAAKFGVRGFTDALRMELEIEGSTVSATSVHPGGIRTNIARNARTDEAAADLMGDDDLGEGFDQLARTTPAKAARVILDGVERDKRRVLIGVDARLFDVLSRLPAGVYQRAIVAGARARRRRR
jgi:cation diffusion facilitator CzcD-associated flavoprotein CzcO/NAD(P)-dependent dehydrogenase (short-subunit alcohol dehydrogenase family)